MRNKIIYQKKHSLENHYKWQNQEMQRERFHGKPIGVSVIKCAAKSCRKAFEGASVPINKTTIY